MNLHVPIKQMEVPGIVFSMAFDWTGNFLFLGAVETILVRISLLCQVSFIVIDSTYITQSKSTSY
jgi:hypothetical protein